jgi:tetratricopeptide (TPR) repeat protein
MNKLIIKMGLIILFFAVSIKNTSLYSQNLDSLLAELPKQKEDTNKVDLLGEIVKEYIHDDIEKQPKYILEIISLSKKIHYPFGEAMGYVRYADYYRRVRDWEKALPYLHLADSIYTKTNNQRGKSTVDNFMGAYYTENGQFEKALTMHQKALDYFRSVHDKSAEGVTLGVIAKLFYYMQRYDESEKYYLLYLNIFNELGNKKEVSIALLNIGSIHTLKAEYDKAEYYFNLCMEIQKELNQTAVIAKIQWNMGWIYAERNQFYKSKKILDESYKNYSTVQDTLMMGLAKMYMAHTYNKSGDYEMAIQLLEEGKVMANIGEADSIVMGDFYKEYYSVYKNNGNYKKALEYHEKFVENKNEVFSTNTANKISELREKYETERKEQENLTLKANNEVKDLKLVQQQFLIYGIGGIALLIILISVLLLRSNRIRTQQKNMQLEQKLLRSQMNPHFIFNALIAIQSFIYKKDPKDAGKFLSSFARLMRAILENSREEYISMDKEVKWMEDYIQLQQLRLGDVFDYQINIDGPIDKENVLIPPMLTQPFIENALEHGFNKIESNGMLSIHFTRKDKMLEVEITDNGEGFDQQEEKSHTGSHTSMATTITRERLLLLNKGKSKKISFEIRSKKDEGTTIRFSIPYRSKI